MPRADVEVPQPEMVSRGGRFPTIPLLLTLMLLGFVALPRVSDNPRLVWTFVGVSAALLAWELVVWLLAERRGQRLKIEFAAYKSHYVQAGAQLCIMLYWAYYWREVFTEIPLIVGQLLFLYIFDALLSWSSGRPWRVGFGPLPIIFSTNLLLWFRDDWFFLQFAMVATGALGKQLIMWKRDGRRRHIFNPSSFGQSLFALVLIATAMTDEMTLGTEIATTFEAPHMLVVIFLVGLVVQYLFHVTLMTLSAAATLLLINLIYTQITGTYIFVNIAIAAPIFLGIHLLITDPSTSPTTNTGRVIFGALYAIAYTVLFWVLDGLEVPLFWDKLLPVPILNLCVPLFDRISRGGLIGAFNRRWETALPTARMNLVHMGVWIAVFAGMMFTGYVDGDHPGNSIPFWKQAVVDDKPFAGHSLVMAAGSQAEGAGSGAAFNELGLICIEGKIVNENHGTAAKYFAQACELGDYNGCANCLIQYLFLSERRSNDDVARALDTLEEKCANDPDAASCFLVGHAYEKGRGRAQNLQRALELYQLSGIDSPFAVKGVARVMIATFNTSIAMPDVAARLVVYAGQGDDEACWYLAYMYALGVGVDTNADLASAYMRQSCKLGLPDACDVMSGREWLPFENPIMLVPGWATAYPLEE